MSPWRVFQSDPEEPKLPFRVLIAFAALVVAFTLSLAAVATAVVANQHRIDDIEKVRAAVCNLRGDQIRRIRVTEAFLKTHPGGFAGVDPALLRQDLRDRKLVVEALAPLECG